MKDDVEKKKNRFAEIEQIFKDKTIMRNNSCEKKVQMIDKFETQNTMWEDKQ